MAVRIEIHRNPRRRGVPKEGGPSPLVVLLGIAAAVVGTHLLFLWVGLLQ